MKIDTISLRGTDRWAYDVPVTVEPGRILFDASWARVNGGNVPVAAHVHDVVKTDELRSVTANLVYAEGTIRIACIEESESAPYVEDAARGKMVGQVCVAVIPPGSDTPSELRLVTAGPAPAWAVEEHEPLPVMRPDLESAAIERSKLHVQRERARKALESLQQHPLDISRGLTPEDRDRLIVALLRVHGLVTLPDTKEPVSHR